MLVNNKLRRVDQGEGVECQSEMSNQQPSPKRNTSHLAAMQFLMIISYTMPHCFPTLRLPTS
jgi:hypothetical protein